MSKKGKLSYIKTEPALVLGPYSSHQNKRAKKNYTREFSIWIEGYSYNHDNTIPSGFQLSEMGRHPSSLSRQEHEGEPDS